MISACTVTVLTKLDTFLPGHHFTNALVQISKVMQFTLKSYYAHLNTFVQSYDIASETLNSFKKIYYMY